MKAKRRQYGITLTEMTVVVAVVALLASLSAPAVRTFFNSLGSPGSTEAMISAALSSARAIAAKEQKYAGIRFQKAFHSEGPLKAAQYMILIVHDPGKTNLANGFRAVEGIKPVKLPENIEVMEFVASDAEIYNSEIINKTTFSIVFSPSGKLVIHFVRIRNRDGRTLDTSNDDIFNTENNVTNISNPIGMFIQDEYDYLGLDEELSQKAFIIYDKREFEGLDEGRRWSDYLQRLDVIHINPYTGTVIKN